MFFTVILAAIFLHEKPTSRQGAGLGVSVAGLVLIGATVGTDDLTLIGLALGLGSALSWALGNVLLKRIPSVPMLPLIVWLSLVPPLPALAVSAIADQGFGLFSAIATATWPSLASAFYLGAIATVAAYAIWGRLLANYTAAQVAPFALLAPCTGTIGSWLAFGEAFDPFRYAGMFLILVGVVIAVLPITQSEAKERAN